MAKEGEGRMASAALLWKAGQRADAEAEQREACARFDKLEADAVARKARRSGGPHHSPPPRLKFHIEDARRWSSRTGGQRLSNGLAIIQSIRMGYHCQIGTTS